MDFCAIVEESDGGYSADRLSEEDRRYLRGYEHGYSDAMDDVEWCIDEEDEESFQGKIRMEIMQEVLDWLERFFEQKKAEKLVVLIDDADYIMCEEGKEKGDGGNG